MAVVRVNFYSEQLMRMVSFNALIPNDGAVYPGQTSDFSRGEMKTLYLLHGIMGDENDYLLNTRIRELSDKYKLAVIMPAGENQFYVDDQAGRRNAGEYVGKELVEYTRRLFHLSAKRENTFIGGLSMGGYGAMRNGLKYAETFSKICSFSGAFIVLRIIDSGGRAFEDDVSDSAFQHRIFGDLEKLQENEMDPRVLYLEQKKKNIMLPDIFMTEGTEDFLVDVNHKLRDFLLEHGANLTYIEDSGEHNWDFWNKHLEEAFQWLVEEDKDIQGTIKERK